MKVGLGARVELGARVGVGVRGAARTVPAVDLEASASHEQLLLVHATVRVGAELVAHQVGVVRAGDEVVSERVVHHTPAQVYTATCGVEQLILFREQEPLQHAPGGDRQRGMAS